ncbi:MAG TPA: DNA recombination protein RmuC [Thermodesulfovibrionales bacterium]|nr:DNA recombination protein RmuC [Thermodesulfovibrionales bacterium]
MPELMLIAMLVLVVGIAVLLLVLLKRSSNTQIETQLSSVEKDLERTERTLKEEIAKNREETTGNARHLREEVVSSLTSFNDSLLKQMTNISELQEGRFKTFSGQLADLTQTNEQKLEKMRETVEERLKALQEDNTKKLDKMRETVDEKLHSTLERRLGESFKLVSERLELVHKGLGEMQNLAVGVGDLKKVLSNVKTRGILGEIQLGNILEQILTAEQYATNVATKKGSRDHVEFAIKLPGKDDSGDVVYLPLDAKFPREHYDALIAAYEHGDPAAVEGASKLLEGNIKKFAKDIKDKYIDPPHTTDFGIMFLPVEGLYAEVVKRPGLIETLQRDFKIIITGPTTLAAILNSLQMGFRTLAIEKRSSEVWTLLGAVKTEFGKFGDILEKTQKKLQEASNTIEDAAKKSRTIERRLKNVQELPSTETPALIGNIEEAENEVN